MNSYDLNKINAYVDKAKELEPINFKTLYFWLTEAFDWAGSPRGVPSQFLIEFGQMFPWEKANTVHHLGLHMQELMKKDFRKLVDDARDWDYKQSLQVEGRQQMIEKGWWEDEQGRLRSPLDDPNCPFLLESDDSPK